MKKKLTAITNADGKIVATQVGHGDTADVASGLSFSIVAGPGQTVHKIEYDMPELRSPADLDEFHKKLEHHLKAHHKTA
jgi:hypothetical protein